MEDMPLPALFEQARKIHATATEFGADQVHRVFSSFLFLSFILFLCLLIEYGFLVELGACEEGMRGFE